jgi:hypothetical protein
MKNIGLKKFTGMFITTLLVSSISYGMSAKPTTQAKASVDAITEFQNSWAGKALTHQRNMDADTPLAQNNILGSHNSYNSREYRNATRYLDPQQNHSIYDQLRIGARFIELDAHWTAHTHGWPWEWGTDLLLCHSGIGVDIGDLHLGCSLTDRFVKDGVAEVGRWLNENPNEVIILYFEDHTDGHHQKLLNIINDKLSGKVYASNGCQAIPNTLTKNQVRAAGKQVVLWKDGGCSSNTGMKNLAFTGLGDINRIWEDRTSVGAIGAFFTNGSVKRIEASDVIQAFKNGGNIVNLDNLTYDDGRMSAGVWSWDANEPNNAGGNQDCAVQWSNGRWDDANCSNQHFFACLHNQTGEWNISTYNDVWSDGQNACSILGDYRFSAPKNSKENEALKAAKNGMTHVWINANDISNEGNWISQ